MIRLVAISVVLSLQIAICEEAWKSTLQNYCFDCHDSESEKGDLNLEDLIDLDLAAHSEVWEKTVRQLQARQMPPIGKDRPDDAQYEEAISQLIAKLDQLPVNPGRTATIRRLNRSEYKNAVRDLFRIEVDVTKLLPPDESSHGFDNITVGNLSPSLLDRYLSAAGKISSIVVGSERSSPDVRTIRIAPDLTQEKHIEGLPLGTRGGTVIPHNFPRSGVYEIQVRLSRDRNELIEGLRGTHQLEFLLNNQPKASLKISPPKNNRDHTNYDANLSVRIPVPAGNHKLGVTFADQSSPVLETLRQPYEASFNYHRHPRTKPALYQVSITGPFEDKGAGNPEFRHHLFPDENHRRNLASLMQLAWRRPVVGGEIDRIMEFHDQGGLEMALSAILVSRNFILRIEKQPGDTEPDTPYPISNYGLASRLSFFLWSSIPDEELLAAADSNDFDIEKQALRMLKNKKADSLVRNFANQWLYLRNLDSITPDGRLFPDFDDNLREAFKKETELLFKSVVRQDRSVLDLISTNETYLNERLAAHYEIPHVRGSRFRKIRLPENSERGGLLRHGSILTVTSYATRTSPVIRGNWILENFLGTPPPPPPPDVPTLDDAKVSASLPIRERLAAHRENAACASCHNVMDPIGFSLENFDAVGRWREMENGIAVDAEGSLPGSEPFQGIEGLEKTILERPELFVRTLTEKLLTFALGRGVTPSDAPAIRQIVREAKEADYRFSAIISGIVKSPPFTMRLAE